MPDISTHANRARMRVLVKDEPYTWRASQDRMLDLDFVVANDHLRFTRFDDASVSVRGWPKLQTETERREWTARYSDHALLFFEMHVA